MPGIVFETAFAIALNDYRINSLIKIKLGEKFSVLIVRKKKTCFVKPFSIWISADLPYRWMKCSVRNTVVYTVNTVVIDCYCCIYSEHCCN